jgi:hypothetical protein
VLYINNPVAGLDIVDTSILLVKATLEGKKPLLVDDNSSKALLCGALVPIPTCEYSCVVKIKMLNKMYFFINKNF